MSRAAVLTAMVLTTGALAACGISDERSSFGELRVDPNGRFRFEAVAYYARPESDPTAEAERIGWMESWLRDAGCSAWVLEGRRAVLLREAALGPSHRVAYVGHCNEWR